MSGLFIIAGITLTLAIFAVLKIPHLTGGLARPLLLSDAVTVSVLFDIDIPGPRLSVDSHPAEALYQIHAEVHQATTA